MSRATTYRHLVAGHLRAIKIGTATRIDYPAGIAWLAAQPQATFTKPTT